MSSRKSVGDEKKQLLSRLLLSVKSCQSRFGSRTELATEDDKLIRQLCSAFEDVFLSGVKKPSSQSSTGLWQITENLVPGLRSTEVLSYWPLIKSQLSKHEAERFLLLHNVRTDWGRGRAWLRAALNEHCLERYIHVVLSLDNLDSFYDDTSFLRDDELSSILPQTAAGLGSILFALIVDNPELDKGKVELIDSTMEDPIAKSVSELAEVADEAVEGKTLITSSIEQSGTKLRKGKKKKKIPIAYVSFGDDTDSPVSTTSATSSVPSSSLNTPTDKQPPIPIGPSKSTVTVDKTHSSIPSIPVSPSTVIITSSKEIPIHVGLSVETEKPTGIYSSSVKSSDNLSLYSDSSDRLEVEILSLAGILPSDRLKPVGSEGNNFCLNFNGDPDRIQDLIPVPSYMNGEEDGSDDIDYEKTSTSGSVRGLTFPMTSDAQPQEERSTDNDDRVRKLKRILDHELEMVTALKAQLGDDTRRYNDQTKILETRVETLTKENELLKHQLKKYIGAVQLLKDADHVRRMSMDLHEIDIMEIPIDDDEKSTEAAEYERKLIQVAEMHGELMEFNAHLQGVLQRKDHALKTLRAELEDLRGPSLHVPGLDDEDDLETPSLEIPLQGTGTRQQVSFSRQLSLNERILINIWIPSAFLTGATNDLHHVYQVFIRIKDTEWNVYRRYSQFHNFYRDLKKKDSIFGSFAFPPKKHLGNKDTKFVDERRRKLQEYLRKVINHTLRTNPALAFHPDKNLLISILPFFGEIIQPPPEPRRSRSRTRHLFSRQLVSSEQQFFQRSGSGHPQYTGL